MQEVGRADIQNLLQRPSCLKIVSWLRQTIGEGLIDQCFPINQAIYISIARL